MRNLRVFGISDIPITTTKLNAIVQCFFLFSLTISPGSSLKTKIAASITSSTAFSPHCPKVTDKYTDFQP